MVFQNRLQFQLRARVNESPQLRQPGRLCNAWFATIFSTYVLCNGSALWGENWMLQISHARSGGKVKRTGVRCIKPTIISVPVSEQVWLNMCLWSKLNKRYDRCSFSYRLIVCRHFWLLWAQLSWTLPFSPVQFFLLFSLILLFSSLNSCPLITH